MVSDNNNNKGIPSNEKGDDAEINEDDQLSFNTSIPYFTDIPDDPGFQNSQFVVDDDYTNLDGNNTSIHHKPVNSKSASISDGKRIAGQTFGIFAVGGVILTALFFLRRFLVKSVRNGRDQRRKYLDDEDFRPATDEENSPTKKVIDDHELL